MVVVALEYVGAAIAEIDAPGAGRIGCRYCRRPIRARRRIREGTGVDGRGCGIDLDQRFQFCNVGQTPLFTALVIQFLQQ